jgi:hypothetical protein
MSKETLFLFMCAYNVPIEAFDDIFDYINTSSTYVSIALRFKRSDVVLSILKNNTQRLMEVFTMLVDYKDETLIKEFLNSKYLPCDILNSVVQIKMDWAVKYIMETHINPFNIKAMTDEEYLTLIYLIWETGCFDSNNENILQHMKFIIQHMIEICNGTKCVLLEQIVSLYVKNMKSTDRLSVEMYLFLTNSRDNNNTMAENVFLQYKDVIGEFWMKQY